MICEQILYIVSFYLKNTIYCVPFVDSKFLSTHKRDCDNLVTLARPINPIGDFFMIQITINGDQRELVPSQLGWATNTVKRLKREGLAVAIRIEISCDGLNMTLFSADYPRSSGVGGGGRMPNPDECMWFARWNELGLNSADFASGQLTRFLTALLKTCR